MYLLAIMDWYSRYVLAWELSNSLDADFCVETLEKALKKEKPINFNTDQGSQFTSIDFTQTLIKNNIKISMDGRGRAFDNIFVERLWRTVKYENIFLNHYESVPELRAGLKNYFDFYNFERLHQSLDYKTPLEVYLNKN